MSTAGSNSKQVIVARRGLDYAAIDGWVHRPGARCKIDPTSGAGILAEIPDAIVPALESGVVEVVGDRGVGRGDPEANGCPDGDHREDKQPAGESTGGAHHCMPPTSRKVPH